MADVYHSAHATFVARKKARIALSATLCASLVVIFLLSLTVGQYDIAIGDIGRILGVGPLAVTTLEESVIWQIRLPRLVLGLLVGAALGVGGALMQAVFANPLAEPSVIGVTSGAGVGAAVVIVFGLNFLGATTVAFFAFVAAIITTVLVYQLSRFGGRVNVTSLILVGIAVNAVAGAAISLLVFFAPTTSREEIIFWQMGTLSGAQWSHVSIIGAIVACGIVASWFIRKQLDVLALGERAATHVGVNVVRLRLVAILLATLLTAGAVSFAGIIGFVGLIVPHIVRSVAGPSNAILIPVSALGGAALIGLADIGSRTLIPFADLPIGIFTALVGGPTFFILFRQMLRKGRH